MKYIIKLLAITGLIPISIYFALGIASITNMFFPGGKAPSDEVIISFLVGLILFQLTCSVIILVKK
jgi:hypothetical protein